MSKKSVVQRSLFEQTVDDTLFSIFKPNKQLKSMDTSIKENPDVVKSCPCDLTEHLRNTGSGGISAERILRTAILKQLKSYFYRG